MSRIEIDGLRLNVEQTGSGPPVVLVHGFTGAAAGWAALADTLAPRFTAIAIDIAGHGRSDAPDAVERYRMRRCVDDLAAVLRSLGHERAAWLGYSMGGRTALQVAVHRPDVVSALVLEGATPGFRTAEERAARVASDEALAGRIEREGVEAFVDEWQELPLFGTQQRMPQAAQDAVRAGRLANRATGLANSLRGMGTGAQEAVHDRLGGVAVPVLLVTGALDERFTQAGREMAQTLPNATMALIDDAGHAAHIERPEAFATVALEFLRRVHVAAA